MRPDGPPAPAHRQRGIDIPAGLRRNVEHHPAGPGWLAGLPAQVGRLADRWGLTVAPPFTTGVAAWTAPARTRSGADVVLKLSLPHDEAHGEAPALGHWDGRGAVRLLAHAPEEWALLLERCRPGTGLDVAPVADRERLLTGARVLRSLLAAGAEPPPGIRTMAATGARGADVLLGTAQTVARHRDRPLRVDRALVREAADLLRDLPRSAGRDVLVHGDLNPGNVLRAGPRWLAIDPKPLVGDPAYDPWPLLAQVGAPFAGADPVAALRARVTLVAGEAGLEDARVRAWSFACCVQSAFWYAAEGRWEPAADELARARVWARLLG